MFMEQQTAWLEMVGQFEPVKANLPVSTCSSIQHQSLSPIICTVYQAMLCDCCFSRECSLRWCSPSQARRPPRRAWLGCGRRPGCWCSGSWLCSREGGRHPCCGPGQQMSLSVVEKVNGRGKWLEQLLNQLFACFGKEGKIRMVVSAR